MFDWMAWTLPVAVFFCSIVLMLVGMTFWELKSPTIERKGFLPIATTRGDRLFIGPCALAQGQSGCGTGHGVQAQFHLGLLSLCFPVAVGAGWGRIGRHPLKIIPCA